MNSRNDLGRRRAVAAGVLGGLLVVAGAAAAVSFEQRWGLESSRAALIAGQEIPELDQALDTQRVIDSTITYAEQQGTYREKLKTQPTCYDPSQPERMPWYVAPHYEWRSRELVNTNVFFRGGAVYGESIRFGVNFADGTVNLLANSCGAYSLYQVSPPLGSTICEATQQSPPDDRILQREIREEVRLSGWNVWFPPEFLAYGVGLDDSIYIYADVLPSCDNGLQAEFRIVDDASGCKTTWSLSAQWYVDVKITLWELWDVTPELYPDCFYPGRHYEHDPDDFPQIPPP